MKVKKLYEWSKRILENLENEKEVSLNELIDFVKNTKKSIEQNLFFQINDFLKEQKVKVGLALLKGLEKAKIGISRLQTKVFLSIKEGLDESQDKRF